METRNLRLLVENAPVALGMFDTDMRYLAASRRWVTNDEKALADIEKQMLNWLGYEVEVRTSAIEALEAFRSNPDKFDLIITDFSMPQITGTKLAGQMTQIRPGMPIILCTGFSEQIDEKQAFSTGIKSVLLKPLVAKELAEEIRKALTK
jgi:two-component system, cell cycle sensor histidine kinase and response regulator CckA